MLKENISIHGKMRAVLTKENGEIKSFESDNIIVLSGFDFICNALGAASGRPGVMDKIAVGTGGTTPNESDTDLQSPILLKAASYAHVAGTKVFTITSVFNVGEATGALVEAGVKNSDGIPILLDRVTFGVINKESNDSLTMTFTFTFA